MATVSLPGGVVSLTGENADRLLALGQGDAALLYVALLRWGGDLPQARRALGWTQGRVDGAYRALLEAALVGPAPQTGRPEPLRPEYVTGDLLAALEGDPEFARMERQVESQLGRLLSSAELKTLYYIYDYLALPAEVVTLVAAWCVEESERKYGPGRRPRLSELKKTAQRWRENGIDTLEEAEAYIRRQGALRSREAQLLPAVGIRDREPLDREREYLATWLDWGFGPEAVAMAYQRTLMKKQTMSWAYLNSILKSWHGKGLHTPREIEAGDAAPARNLRETPAEDKSRRVARDIADLKRAAGKEG